MSPSRAWPRPVRPLWKLSLVSRTAGPPEASGLTIYRQPPFGAGDMMNCWKTSIVALFLLVLGSIGASELRAQASSRVVLQPGTR